MASDDNKGESPREPAEGVSSGSKSTRNDTLVIFTGGSS